MIKTWIYDVLLGAGLFAALIMLILFSAGKQTLFTYSFF